MQNANQQTMSNSNNHIRNLTTTKLWIFDFDGTLKKTNSIKRESFYSTVDHIPESRYILDEIFSKHPLYDRFDVFASLSRALNVNQSAKWVEKYSDRCHKKILAADTVPGALELLTEIHSLNSYAYICSATPQEQMRNIVKDLDWQHLFTDVLGSPNSKSENYRKALSMCGILARDALVIGDGGDDQEGAELCGIKFIGVKSDNNQFKRPPDLLISNLYDLKHYLSTQQ